MFAVIDIGTNSVLLLVATWVGKKFRVIRDEARITRLGEGLHRNQHLLESAMRRTLQALQGYQELCRQHSVKKTVAVGTAALRKAKNGREFAQQLAQHFDWEVKIISGEEEARLSYLSVKNDFSKRYSNLVALDIGGGSTEIISKGGAVSLELGTVVLSEKIFRHDPVTNEEVQEAEKTIRDRLITPPHPPSYLKRGALIALAGTATTLSSINQKLARWDPEKIQGSTITLQELEAMIALLRSTKNEARKTIVGMVPGREDTLLAGSLILHEVMKSLGVDSVVVSDRGLRYGIFYDRFS